MAEKNKNQSEKTSNKKKQKGVSKLYKIENDKISRLRPTCERCGSGYTRYKQVK